MDRVILHSDMNSCFASIELLHHPELRGKPMAVVGDPEARHGIVLAKEDIAKRAGIKTGMALWQAKRLCPGIVFLRPRYDIYKRFSNLARAIYSDYTDKQEPFGLDECWLDVTELARTGRSGYEIADEIRKRIHFELGITVSIGVSWNKIFAKLGSDYKKPNAVTVIDKDNYQNIVWPLPASDLLFVGKSTKKRLTDLGIRTIGELAHSEEELLYTQLGKMGPSLKSWAMGLDAGEVTEENYHYTEKSIGNSTTQAKDLTNDAEVKATVIMLSEQVGERLRKGDYTCSTVEISIRNAHLKTITRQKKLDKPTDVTNDIVEAAMELFHEHYEWTETIRSMGVRVTGLASKDEYVQMDLFSLVGDNKEHDKKQKVDKALDEIRSRFGKNSIKRAVNISTEYWDRD